jgi:SagB-type dehydrogenase family enzyme
MNTLILSPNNNKINTSYIMLDIKEKYSTIEKCLYGCKNIENSLAVLYHENSKLTNFGLRIFENRIINFSTSNASIKATRPYKCYPNKEIIDLSNCSNLIPQNAFQKCLFNRRSTRKYDENHTITLEELSTLLYNSYGVTYKAKAKHNDEEIIVGFRNVPSGGALYPLEIYVVVFNSEIQSGIYHYNVFNNLLELVKIGYFMEELITIIKAEPFVEMKKSSALIITTGVIERVLIKYGDRGYRFMLQESGFVGQLISLIAESINLGSCMLGGFLDDEVNDFLELDGTFEAVNNIIVIGKKSKE